MWNLMNNTKAVILAADSERGLVIGECALVEINITQSTLHNQHYTINITQSTLHNQHYTINITQK